MTLPKLLLINGLTFIEFIYTIVVFWVIIIVISEIRNYIGNQNTRCKMIDQIMPLMYYGKLKITQCENKELVQKNKNLVKKNQEYKVKLKVIAEELGEI